MSENESKTELFSMSMAWSCPLGCVLYSLNDWIKYLTLLRHDIFTVTGLKFHVAKVFSHMAILSLLVPGMWPVSVACTFFHRDIVSITIALSTFFDLLQSKSLLIGPSYYNTMHFPISGIRTKLAVLIGLLFVFEWFIYFIIIGMRHWCPGKYAKVHQ